MPDDLSRDGIKDRYREQSQSNHEQARHGSPVESNAQCRSARHAGSLSRADICQHGDAHANEACRQRTKRADYKSNRCGVIFKNEKQNENDHRDHADRLDLPIQISLRAFLHGCRDLAHFFVAGGVPHNGHDKEIGESQPDNGAHHRQRHSRIQNS